MELEVHTNVTMRSAPRQSSKRHKQFPSQLNELKQDVIGNDKAASDAVRGNLHGSTGTLVIAKSHQILQHYTSSKEPARSALPVVLGQSQDIGNRWTRPLPRTQKLCLPPAAQMPITDRVMPDVQTAHHSSLSSRATAVNLTAQPARQAQPVTNRQNVGKAELSEADCDVAGKQAVGVVASSILAARLHSMQADARDKAWHEQKSQETARHRAPLANVSAHAAPNAGSNPMPCMITSASVAAVTARGSEVTSTSSAGHHAVSSQPAWKQRTVFKDWQASCDSVDACTAVGEDEQAPTRLAEGPDNTCEAAQDMQMHVHEMRHVLDRQQAPTAGSSARSNLSDDTESLVAKLRALSQGRGDAASSMGLKTDGQQLLRFPFASRTTTSHQSTGNMRTGSAAGPSAAAPRLKQCDKHMAGIAPSQLTHQPAAGCILPCRPDNTRCIKLMKPAQSATASDSGSDTDHPRRSHQLQSPAQSPSHGSRHRSVHTSVVAPIQLGSHELTSAAPTLPAAAATRMVVAATSNGGQQQQETAVQHRIGKATPLKKSFTPRPSRFRLEAEKLSVTPPDKSSSLEKVLFRSPIKAEYQFGHTQDVHLEGVFGNAWPESCQAAQHQDEDNTLAASNSNMVSHIGYEPSQAAKGQPMDKDDAQAEPSSSLGDSCMRPTVCQAQQNDMDMDMDIQAAPALQHEEQSSAMLMCDAENDHSMITPANLPQGVFSHMRVILDPDLTSEEGARYVADYLGAPTSR